MNRIMIGAVVTLAGTAGAQVSPVGPFAGNLNESFETLSGNYVPCVTPRGFGGTADICTPNNSSAVVTQFWSMFCVVSARTGTNIFGSGSGPVEVAFDTPVSAFGGYFATCTNSPGGVASFFDGQGGTIGQAPIATDGCAWTWSGWQSTTPIARVRITGSWPLANGGMLQMDDLTARAGVSCYANCDGSTTAPVLNVLDFTCFLNRFAAADTYANCDGSTTAPVLNVLDFTCFLNRFAAGCG